METRNSWSVHVVNAYTDDEVEIQIFPPSLAREREANFWSLISSEKDPRISFKVYTREQVRDYPIEWRQDKPGKTYGTVTIKRTLSFQSFLIRLHVGPLVLVELPFFGISKTAVGALLNAAQIGALGPVLHMMPGIGSGALGVLLASGGLIGALVGTAARVKRTSNGFSRIFASYSRKDKHVVESVESIMKLVDSVDFRWDVKILRSGDRWEETLLKEIKSADSFQLFWSENARTSQNVRKEWKYALTLNRERFIRPVYWSEPIPKRPKELNVFNFTKINLGN